MLQGKFMDRLPTLFTALVTVGCLEHERRQSGKCKMNINSLCLVSHTKKTDSRKAPSPYFLLSCFAFKFTSALMRTSNLLRTKIK